MIEKRVGSEIRGTLEVDSKKRLAFKTGGIWGFQTPATPLAKMNHECLYFWSSSESRSVQLSDKTKYEYFARVVPSDTFQAQAIVDLLVHYNWTYLSLINSEGGYGETGAKFVYRLATERGLCVAVSHTIYRARGIVEFDDVARLLAANEKARAVVMFVQVNG